LQVPGPGEYSPDTSPPPRAGPAVAATHTRDAAPPAAPAPPAAAPAAQSSSFATKVLRESQRGPQLCPAGPGPGQYSPNCKDAIRAPRSVPKEHQFFSSTARRGYEVDPVQLLSAPTYLRGPGPGAYSTEMTAFARQPLADPACSAFASTQARLAPCWVHRLDWWKTCAVH
jgi:Sperm-tail PG-rich repeat